MFPSFGPSRWSVSPRQPDTERTPSGRTVASDGLKSCVLFPRLSLGIGQAARPRSKHHAQAQGDDVVRSVNGDVLQRAWLVDVSVEGVAGARLCSDFARESTMFVGGVL